MTYLLYVILVDHSQSGQAFENRGTHPPREASRQALAGSTLDCDLGAAQRRVQLGIGQRHPSDHGESGRDRSDLQRIAGVAWNWSRPDAAGWIGANRSHRARHGTCVRRKRARTPGRLQDIDTPLTRLGLRPHPGTSSGKATNGAPRATTTWRRRFLDLKIRYPLRTADLDA